MKMLQRTRLAVAVLALGGLGLGSAAQADPFVGRLIGSVAAGMLVNGAIKNHDKKFAAQCRLYDREGMEVYLPCDSRRPIGEVLVASRPDMMPDRLAGAAPAVVAVAPPEAPHGAAAYAHGRVFADAAPMPHYSALPQTSYTAPIEDDCRCRHDGRGADTASLSGRGGLTQSAYAHGGFDGVYDAYGETRSSSAVSYGETYEYSGGYAGGSYGYGVAGGSSGFYPYGGHGYEAGGYAQGPARVAGRDAQGFLTWPGKRVR